MLQFLMVAFILAVTSGTAFANQWLYQATAYRKPCGGIGYKYQWVKQQTCVQQVKKAATFEEQLLSIVRQREETKRRLDYMRALGLSDQAEYYDVKSVGQYTYSRAATDYRQADTAALLDRYSRTVEQTTTLTDSGLSALQQLIAAEQQREKFGTKVEALLHLFATANGNGSLAPGREGPLSNLTGLQTCIECHYGDSAKGNWNLALELTPEDIERARVEVEEGRMPKGIELPAEGRLQILRELRALQG